MAAHSFGDFNLQVGAIAFHMAVVAGMGLSAASMTEPPGGAPASGPEEGGAE